MVAYTELELELSHLSCSSSLSRSRRRIAMMKRIMSTAKWKATRDRKRIMVVRWRMRKRKILTTCSLWPTFLLISKFWC